MMEDPIFEENHRKVPLWLPLTCFGLAALLFLLGETVGSMYYLKDMWWAPLPLGFVSLSVLLRSKGA